MIGQRDLTRPWGAETARSHQMTVPGMAAFADVGSLHTCSQCVWWRAGKAGKGTCDLHQRRMGGKVGAAVAGSQKACRAWSSDLGVRQRVDRPPLDTSDLPPPTRIPGT
jgi:hypothetical protein